MKSASYIASCEPVYSSRWYIMVGHEPRLMYVSGRSWLSQKLESRRKGEYSSGDELKISSLP